MYLTEFFNIWSIFFVFFFRNTYKNINTWIWRKSFRAWLVCFVKKWRWGGQTKYFLIFVSIVQYVLRRNMYRLSVLSFYFKSFPMNIKVLPRNWLFQIDHNNIFRLYDNYELYKIGNYFWRILRSFFTIRLYQYHLY